MFPEDMERADHSLGAVRWTRQNLGGEVPSLMSDMESTVSIDISVHGRDVRQA